MGASPAKMTQSQGGMYLIKDPHEPPIRRSYTGFFRSGDGGAVWDSLPVGSPGDDFTAIGTADGALFLGTGDKGVFRSQDRGKTWTPVHLMQASIFDFASLDGDLFAAGGGAGIYRSRDNGATWTEENRGLPSDATVYGLAAMGNSVIAATAQFVFRSDDRGGSWRQFKTGYAPA